MKNSVLKEKSFSFGLQIVLLCQQLKIENKEHVLKNQLLKSGTSIGALIREAAFAQSKADFINKMYIALKEANETAYWLELLNGSENISRENYNLLYAALNDLLHILIATIKTAKANKLKCEQ